MTTDPIVDEIHRLRAEEMQRLDFDFEAFFRDLKEQEKLSGKPLVPPPTSPPKLSGQRSRSVPR